MFQICRNGFDRGACISHGLEEIWTLPQRQTDRQMERQMDRQLTGISLASLVIICSRYAGIVLIGGPVLVMVWKKYGLRLAMSRRARHA